MNRAVDQRDELSITLEPSQRLPAASSEAAHSALLVHVCQRSRVCVRECVCAYTSGYISAVT